MKKRIWLLVLAIGLVAAACGNDSGGDEAAPAGDGAAAQTDDTGGSADGADDEMSDDEMSDDEMSDDEMSDDEMSDDEMSDDEMSDDEMVDDEMSDDEMSDDEMSDATTFLVTVENISGDAPVPTPIAPGVWVVTGGMAEALFSADAADRGEGLEALAEDGDPSALAAAVEGDGAVLHSGVFDTPVGADEPGPATPGSSYAFEITGIAGDYLNFATMLVQSNDQFFAAVPEGIALFDEDGNPISGDISELFLVWDAGTEVNEPNGEGPNQAPRQAGPDTGDDEGGAVSEVGPNGGHLRITIEVA